MTVANNTSLCSSVLVVFLEFIPVDRVENFPYEHTTEFVPVTEPGSYEEALNPSHLLYGYNSTRALIGCWAGIIFLYYMALSHKDWELPNPRIWLAKTDIDRGLDFPIYNLGQNKMRNKTTPPPESMMNSRSNQSAPFFPSLKWGEGWS